MKRQTTQAQTTTSDAPPWCASLQPATATRARHTAGAPPHHRQLRPWSTASLCARIRGQASPTSQLLSTTCACNTWWHDRVTLDHSASQQMPPIGQKPKTARIHYARNVCANVCMFVCLHTCVSVRLFSVCAHVCLSARVHARDCVLRGRARACVCFDACVWCLRACARRRHMQRMTATVQVLQLYNQAV